MISVDVSPNGDAAQAFEGLGPEVDAAVLRAVGRTGLWLQTTVKANASGRPGPRVQTGDYRRSIAFTLTREGNLPVAVVSTNAPQARRLEYGFMDVDVLGRNYRQSPFPHWRPAILQVPARLEDELTRALRATGVS